MKGDENIEQAVVKVLQYFDFFQFPLKKREIWTYIGVSCTEDELDLHLGRLLEKEEVYQIEDFYLLRFEPALIERRKKGGIQFQKEISKAKIVAKIIMAFPFVRMVSISGSLSKGYADQKSDIDFFIVTESNNLWVCRSLLHLLKKFTFLFKQEHSFCMNYFIADKHLEIEEQNYFTAIELSTLIPMTGHSFYHDLLEVNSWISSFLPNYRQKDRNGIRKKGTIGGKYLFELILNSQKLNHFLMDLTETKWRKKWVKKGISGADYELAFKTNPYVSKNHPANNQKVVLDKYTSPDGSK